MGRRFTPAVKKDVSEIGNHISRNKYMKIQRICNNIRYSVFFYQKIGVITRLFVKQNHTKTQEENIIEKPLSEQMGGTYTQIKDHLLPNLILPEQQDQTIGVWGQQHAKSLKQHHKIICMDVVLSMM